MGGLGSPKDFQAHEGPIVCATTTKKGTYLATASAQVSFLSPFSFSDFPPFFCRPFVILSVSQGTIIRIHDLLHENRLVNELRRGTKPSSVYNIAFSSDEKMIVVSSSSGTVHVFDMYHNTLSAFLSLLLVDFYSRRFCLLFFITIILNNPYSFVHTSIHIQNI